MQSKFEKANECLKKVLENEDQQLAKVAIYTKIAGNYKKTGQAEQCFKNSTAAFDLSKKLLSELDVQTCKCMLNLAQAYMYFEKKEDAENQFT